MFLDVLLKEGEGLRGFSVVLDSQRGASSGLSGDTSLVVLGLANPLTELLSVLDLDQRNVVLLGKGGDELFVLGVVAVGGEHAQVGILSVQGLSNLVQSLHKA